jgi:hypothetical protein
MLILTVNLKGLPFEKESQNAFSELSVLSYPGKKIKKVL